MLSSHKDWDSRLGLGVAAAANGEGVVGLYQQPSDVEREKRCPSTLLNLFRTRWKCASIVFGSRSEGRYRVDRRWVSWIRDELLWTCGLTECAFCQGCTSYPSLSPSVLVARYWVSFNIVHLAFTCSESASDYTANPSFGAQKDLKKRLRRGAQSISPGRGAKRHINVQAVSFQTHSSARTSEISAPVSMSNPLGVA